MMKKIGIEDYDMRDLIRADSNRVRLVLSAIINFAKFREEHLGILDELSGKAESLLESKRLVTKKKSGLLDKIAALQYALTFTSLGSDEQLKKGAPMKRARRPMNLSPIWNSWSVSKLVYQQS